MMQLAYKIATLFFLSLMLIGIVWVTALEIRDKRRKKARKEGKWHPNQNK